MKQYIAVSTVKMLIELSASTNNRQATYSLYTRDTQESHIRYVVREQIPIKIVRIDWQSRDTLRNWSVCRALVALASVVVQVGDQWTPPDS